MFDGHLRAGVDKTTGPIGEALAKTPLSADSLTIAGIVISMAAGIVIASGRLWVGFILVIAGTVPDLLDGPLAKTKGTTSKRGAFFDSFSDRVSDLFLFGGLGWYYLHSSRPGMAALPFGIYGAASLISYQRAKAESLGFSAKGGIMERGERIFALAAGLLFSPILVAVLWLTLGLSVVTVIQRFMKIWSQASMSVAGPPRRLRKGHDAPIRRPFQRSDFFRSAGSRRSSHPRRRAGASPASSSFSRWLEHRGARSFGDPES
ncbi:MAG: CDP-alcohol phosphatidyltransferase family protein [Actinomycetota bacterium]|nr:MAG: CDP-alcohol phosphatidyltransferase family protein [Actinomycetota bacterium]